MLHGYGADGEDLIGLAQPLGQVMPHALFAAPDGPARCAQSPFGFEWFPLAFDAMRESARIGVPQARAVVVEYLAETWRQTGLEAGQTFLIGFSQGAMVALHVGLSLPEPVLGIVSFSGALVPPDEFDTPGRQWPPVCLIHGDADNVVDPMLTQQAAEALAGVGVEVSLHVSRGMAHGVAPDGLEFAAKFMLGRLGDSATD
jgi:phospholipase/carboxylesterase